MLEAPKGFIPLSTGGVEMIVNVRHIVAVVQREEQEPDPVWEAEREKAQKLCLAQTPPAPYPDWTAYPVMRGSGRYSVNVTWAAPKPNTAHLSNCSLAQFIARMVEAINETEEKS